MDILRDFHFCFTYLDDILVYSKTPEEHDQHLRKLFQQLTAYGIVVNPTKCIVGDVEVTFLGYKISGECSRPLEERAVYLLACPPPKTVRELRRFLGMLNFYRRFLPHAATTQAPLHDVLAGPRVKGSHPITWTMELKTAFDECKVSLSRAAMLAHPDSTATLALVTKASTTAMGAVLQRVLNAWQPLAFFSRKLSPAQQKYSAYDRELQAICVRETLPPHFIIFTDHKPLVYAFNQKRDKCSPRQFNHLDYISQFTTDIRHISGKDNIVADAISRVETITTPVTPDVLAASQEKDEELRTLLERDTALLLEKTHVAGTTVTLY
jgi:cleavage and polyadenylation specificity factor subunit 1